MRPHFKRERAHGGRVAGVDEVGRGPLAGPVVAVAVVFPAGVPRRVALLIDDSKKLTAAERETAARAIWRCAEIGIGAASVGEIATLNILHAAMLAMRRAVLRLREPPHLALVDGNRAPPGLPCPVECCIGGDALSLSIAAASIIAKVTRDRTMLRLSARYPHYDWHENAGYGTPTHRAALHRHGPTKHHRAAFGTVRLLLQAELLTTSGHDPGVADGQPCPLGAMDPRIESAGDEVRVEPRIDAAYSAFAAADCRGVSGI